MNVRLNEAIADWKQDGSDGAACSCNSSPAEQYMLDHDDTPVTEEWFRAEIGDGVQFLDQDFSSLHFHDNVVHFLIATEELTFLTACCTFQTRGEVRRAVELFGTRVEK